MAGGIDWFRWHHGSVTDPKFQLVARRADARLGDVVTVWAFLLETASASTDRGSIGNLDHEAIDCLLGATDGTAERIVDAMMHRGLLDGDGRVISWDKRQPKREREGDSSADRTRAYRDRQKQRGDAAGSHVTPRDATVTHVTPRGEESREEKENKDMSGKPDAAAQADAGHAKTKAQCVELLEHLNAKAGKRFRPVEANIRLLVARLKESTADEIRAVIDAKAAEWGADAKMAKYLRPETLFNATKFAGYVGELGARAPAQAQGSGWWRRAGFQSEGAAAEAGCHHWNRGEFRDGQRIQERAA